MDETEPRYFSKFRKYIEEEFRRIEEKFDGKFDSMDSKIDSLAASTANGFLQIDFRFDGVENEMIQIKEYIGKIEGHIGRYEVRAQNIEEILNKDYKLRIMQLEKEVF